MLRIRIHVDSGEVVDETFKADGQLVMQKDLLTTDYPAFYHMLDAIKGWIEKIYTVME